jgi:hypothetical protein
MVLYFWKLAIQITKNKIGEIEGDLFSLKQNYKFLNLEDNVIDNDETIRPIATNFKTHREDSFEIMKQTK